MSTVSAPAPQKLFNRNFLLLWQGQLVSHIGNQAFTIGLIYWLKETTGSASLVGLMAMLNALPAFFLGPFGGTLADRHSRRTIILVSDLVRGLAMLALVAWMFSVDEGSTSTLWVVLATACFVSASGALFAPAIGAAIPDLVPRSELARANSLRQVSNGTVGALGQALGGVLFGWLGAITLFLINGLTFLFSAFSELFIRIPKPRKSPSRSGFKAYWQDTKEGLAYAWQQPGIPVLLIAAATTNFFFMPILVLLPFYVDQVLASGVEIYGLAMAAFSGGMLLGSLLAGTKKWKPKSRQQLMIVCLLTLSSAFGMLAFVRSALAAILCLAIVGIASGLFNVLEITLIQLSTPSAMRGRVLALVFAISRAISPLGMGLGGVLGDLSGKNLPWIYGVCALASLTISLLALSRSSLRSFLALDVETLRPST